MIDIMEFPKFEGFKENTVATIERPKTQFARSFSRRKGKCS